MRVERLRLTDFRNYRELELPLPRGLVIFTGRNAQGKSNVLEAVTLAATSRSFRTTNDREVVRWGAPGHFARVEAEFARRAGPLQVEVVVADAGPPREGMPTAAPPQPLAMASPEVVAPPAPPAPFRKRIRVNGAPRRAMDLLGQATVVVFAPTDLEIVTGTPAQRRHFLDVTLCQVHPAYCRALSQMQKVLAQRAALLRRIKEGEEDARALGYWDEQLAHFAVPVMRTRAAFLRAAEIRAARVYAELARDEAGADVGTVGAVALEQMTAEEIAVLVAEAGDVEGAGVAAKADEEGAIAPLRLEYRPSYQSMVEGDLAEAEAGFRARLLELRQRELAQGMNVMGPQRDDLAFLAGGMDLAVYGSRGQQRSAALALKLAELAYVEHETGDQPILLLDDVLSELDEQRRADLLRAVAGLDQVLLTTTDATTVPEGAREGAVLYAVRGGRVHKSAGR
ncbi:MAG TPA: DNA replication/repair protein RecF [Ktedonobacterales bacterium]